MDKKKVIAAYRTGMLTMEECAQILGIDSPRVMGMVSGPVSAAEPVKAGKQSIIR
jgi:hypothetical protein